jgi:hypothetical protein
MEEFIRDRVESELQKQTIQFHKRFDRFNSSGSFEELEHAFNETYEELNSLENELQEEYINKDVIRELFNLPNLGQTLKKAFTSKLRIAFDETLTVMLHKLKGLSQLEHLQPQN